MLTVDHARVKIEGDTLKVRPLGPRTRPLALKLAEQYDGVMRAGHGQSRGRIARELDSVPCGPRQQRLANGLRKLVSDRAEFERPADSLALDIREALFAESVRARRTDTWNRDQIIAVVAKRFELSTDELDSAMYSDLKSEHRLLAYRAIEPDVLLDDYIFAQYEACLLKARSLTADVEFSTSDQAKVFFRKLKFFRLLTEIKWLESHRYRLAISGPHALFRSSTKYGLQLALAFRHLSHAEDFNIAACLEWGKLKKALTMEIEPADLPTVRAGFNSVRDDVDAAISRLRKQSDAWSVSAAKKLIHLPGHDVCVPDILMRHRPSGQKVYVEVMGFWSREAIFRRVELLKGLDKPLVILAASERLRVSEMIGDALTSSRLYVYKGVVNAKRLIGLANELIEP